MKTSRILRSFLLAAALTGMAAQAADPEPQAGPSAADLQALMKLLNKIVAQAAATENAASDEPAPAPTPPPATATPAAPAPAGWQPHSTALRTGSLGTVSVTASGGLNGHGPGTLTRLTEEAWRLLFPAKQPGN